MTGHDERGLAALAHVLGWFTGIVAPLIIYLVKNEDSFARQHATEALNFQLSVLLASVAAGALVLLLVGLVLLPLIWIGNLVFSILAACAAYRGEPYRYPCSFRLVR